jgi:hypothetical protein
MQSTRRNLLQMIVASAACASTADAIVIGQRATPSRPGLSDPLRELQLDDAIEPATTFRVQPVPSRSPRG